MARDKVRIRFRKAGDLRLVSHHDLLRGFERMLRRAALPYHSTEGFNPHPRLVFALSLPLGVIGCEEIVELDLDEELPTDEVQRRLATQAPPGLEILSVQRIALRAKAHVVSATYRALLPAPSTPELHARAAELLASTECWVERTKPETKRLDVRPYLMAVRVEERTVEFDLRVTPNGTARPDEILGRLGIPDLLAQGGLLERSRLVLAEEQLPSVLAASVPVEPTPGPAAAAAASDKGPL